MLGGMYIWGSGSLLAGCWRKRGVCLAAGMLGAQGCSSAPVQKGSHLHDLTISCAFDDIAGITSGEVFSVLYDHSL